MKTIYETVALFTIVGGMTLMLMYGAMWEVTL